MRVHFDVSRCTPAANGKHKSCQKVEVYLSDLLTQGRGEHAGQLHLSDVQLATLEAAFSTSSVLIQHLCTTQLIKFTKDSL